MPIRAIILDVGGVILHERDHTKRFEWEARLGLSQGQLTRLVLDSEPAKHAASGLVAEPEVWRAVGSQLGLSDEQTWELQRDFWSSEQLDTVFVQFLQGLRPPYKVGILSNAWSDARSIHNSKFKFDAWMDGAIYSAEVKLLKPDPRIYELALSQLNLPADACVFVDDKLSNVQVAQTLGMCGVWYRDTPQTIHDIQTCLNGHVAP
ncbi:MAG: HAD family phosphatase [Chloroflexi bacterium]|nr:HAD family phosphatase [Chloroflexota bacterium]